MKSHLELTIALLLGLIPLVGDVQVPVADHPPTRSRTEDSTRRRVAQTGLSSLSEEAQASISGALGRDIRGYQAHVQGAGFHAENARHKLVVDFTSEGVAMHTGRASWRLALRGFGYGNALKAVDAAFPKANLNRVEYQHGPLTEWYVNGPLGLEHGLTVHEPPDEANGEPLTIALALSGDLRAAVDRGRTGLTLTARDQQAELRYSGLTAFDATGIPLQAWLELQGERLLVRVAETGARYPIVIDPWVQLAELTASDGGIYDLLGFSAAVSGNVVVVGAPGATFPSEATGDDRGAVYAFVKPPTGWANMTETAKLFASDGKANDCLGESVVIIGDTVVAGANHCFQDTGVAPGAAYVFVKPSGGWASGPETAKLTPSDGAPLDFFGASVSMSGNTVVVGRPGPPPYSSSGAVYVFVKPPSGWADMTETAKLTTNMANAKGLGTGVSISGNVVVAGTGSWASTTYVFVMPPTGWKDMFPTAKLTSTHRKSPVFSVAIDGDTVVAGAPSVVVGSNQSQGEAYVYVKPPTGWADMTQTAVLTASDGSALDYLGLSATILGNTVVVGAPAGGVGGNTHPGAAYVFVKPTSGWANMTETAKVTSANARSYDRFGWSVAISRGGSPVMVVGAIENTASHVGKGAAYIF